MRIRQRLIVARAAAAAMLAVGVAGAAVSLAGGAAFADSGATSPDVPYSPDPAAIGTIQLFDASGHAQTSGSMTDDPFVAYAMASGTGVNAGAQDTKATLYLYTPTPGQLPVTWQGNSQTTLSTVYPNTAAPANIASSPNAVATVDAGLGTLADYTAANPNTATNNYAGLYELRILTSHAGGSLDPNQYYAADIKVTGTTWTLVNPAPTGPTGPTGPTEPAGPADTTTTLAGNPASADTGAEVTLTATTGSGSSHPAGSVDLTDGAADLGSAAVNDSGVATFTTTFTTTGPHALQAVFTPADADSFNPSTATLTYTVTAPAAPPSTTTLTLNPAAVTTTSTTSLTATLDPSSAAGTVQFTDSDAPIGSPVAVTDGTATLADRSFLLGTHSLKAVFTPTDATAVAGSTSAPQTLTVTCGPQPANALIAADGTSIWTAGDSAPALTAGQSLCLTATGFAANAAVSVTVNSTPEPQAPGTADGNGVVAYNLAVPTDLEPGDHTVVLASSGPSANTVTFAFTMAAQDTGSPTPTDTQSTSTPPPSGTSSAPSGSSTPAPNGGSSSRIANGGGSNLASTGASILAPMIAAILLIGAGGAALLMARRRTAGRRI